MRFSRFRWAWVVRFSLVVGWTVRACGYGMFCYGLSLGLPLTATLYQFRIVQAHFTKYAGCKNIVKNAFVQLKLHKNGYPIPSASNDTAYPTQAIQFFIQSKLLTIQTIPYRYQSKQTIHPRSAQILRKAIAKHHVAAGINDRSPQ